MDESNNILKTGMDHAMLMGVYTSLISLAMLYTDLVPPLGLVTMILLIMGPGVLYFLQRRTQVASQGEYSMWDLWRMGVIAIFFGTIFTAMVTYGVLEYLRPGFLYSQIEMLLDTYSKIPELKNSPSVDALQMILDQDAVPSSFSFALNMFLMTNCSGMLMGMFTAMVAARK